MAPLSAAYPSIGPHARAFDAALQRLMDATGLVGAARTGAHLAVRQFLHGCGGARSGGLPRATSAWRSTS